MKLSIKCATDIEQIIKTKQGNYTRQKSILWYIIKKGNIDLCSSTVTVINSLGFVWNITICFWVVI